MVRVELIIGSFLGGLVNSTGAVAELAQRVNMEFEMYGSFGFCDPRRKQQKTEKIQPPSS